MKILGGHILKMAMSVVGTQCVQYRRFTGRTVNSYGDDVSSYGNWTSVKGQFQSVDRKAYMLLGLQMNKNYATFYSEAEVQDLQRDQSGDQFMYGNHTYEVMSNNDWKCPQGFVGSMGVQIA
jgi:hypothetical protein